MDFVKNQTNCIIFSFANIFLEVYFELCANCIIIHRKNIFGRNNYITMMMCKAQFWTTLGQGHTDSFTIFI
jgi:hypothetical protein